LRLSRPGPRDSMGRFFAARWLFFSAARVLVPARFCLFAPTIVDRRANPARGRRRRLAIALAADKVCISPNVVHRRAFGDRRMLAERPPSLLVTSGTRLPLGGCVWGHPPLLWIAPPENGSTAFSACVGESRSAGAASSGSPHPARSRTRFGERLLH